jgi:predicted dehydrogenase
VYLAKPIAVDVPGCLTIRESGEKATANELCFLVDFQTRANELYREAIKRVQYGDIGRIVSGEAGYQCGPTWDHMMDALRANPDDPEARLRAWGLDRELSGDVITEQNIHALDVACWILDEQPVSAWGKGGRKARDVGSCWTQFSVIYTFPNDIVVTFNSKQFGAGYDDIMCRMYGTRGTVDTHYFGDVTIRGDAPYQGGEVGNLYTDGVVRNIADFYDSITEGRFANTTVPASVRSNLTTILGRTAAYKQREVTWDEMMKANEKMEVNLRGLKA